MRRKQSIFVLSSTETQFIFRQGASALFVTAYSALEQVLAFSRESLCWKDVSFNEAQLPLVGYGRAFPAFMKGVFSLIPAVLICCTRTFGCAMLKKTQN
ncbi:hypothetical protein [Alkalicoccus chagannorensis]|uniref:hypothetical protein n=1 Tax=Alkalicoccus chagannorensis TaxID=427072 RepID=UPI0003FDE4B2|nr:hypothetical protein [Alkalicoccus chagannorensis]